MNRKHTLFIITILVLALIGLSASSWAQPLPAPVQQVAGAPTRTPISPGETPPPKTPARPPGGGHEDDDRRPPPRLRPAHPVSELTFTYTVTEDRIDVRLENTGPDDAVGVCLKVWGSIKAAGVEWGDAAVRPGGANLCWYELYHDNGTTGWFTVANRDLDSYAELHWNGSYRVVTLNEEEGPP
jgi:hypothetical protein